MMYKAGFLPRTCIVLLVLAVQGCATPALQDDAPFEISEDYANNVIRYTVQRGDRLGDIALEFTGDVSAWLPIAKHNDIAEPKALRVGSQIEIPTELIPGYEQKRLYRQQQTNSAKLESATVDSAAPDSVRDTQLNLRNTATLSTASAVSSADTNDEPAGSGSAQVVKAVAQAETQPEPQVKVVGSYYPKGVYERPSMNSKLVMRVAPGTNFPLLERVDGWYGIDTDYGAAYLRADDGRIIDIEG